MDDRLYPLTSAMWSCKNGIAKHPISHDENLHIIVLKSKNALNYSKLGRMGHVYDRTSPIGEMGIIDFNLDAGTETSTISDAKVPYISYLLHYLQLSRFDITL